MPLRSVGIAIDGATGRLGTTQHLKALLAIRAGCRRPRRPIAPAERRSDASRGNRTYARNL